MKNLHIFCCWVLQLFSILKYKRGDSQITSGLTTTHILPCRPTACANNSCKPVCWPCRLHSTGLKIKSSCTFYFQVNCIFLPSFRGDKNTLLFVFGAPCSIRGNSFTHLKHKSMMSNDVFFWDIKQFTTDHYISCKLKKKKHPSRCVFIKK